MIFNFEDGSFLAFGKEVKTGKIVVAMRTVKNKTFTTFSVKVEKKDFLAMVKGLDEIGNSTTMDTLEALQPHVEAVASKEKTSDVQSDDGEENTGQLPPPKGGGLGIQ